MPRSACKKIKLFVITIVLVSWHVRACSICQCGDATLTTLGMEKPYAGRLRFSLENRFRTERVGANTSQHDLIENKILLSGAFAPSPWLILGVSQPVEWKRLSTPNGSTDEVYGIGDLTVHTRAFLWGNRETRGRHLLGMMAGVRAPTAPRQRDASGQILNADVQPGTGGWYPSAGAWQAYFNLPWMVYSSVMAQFSTKGWNGFKAGENILVNSQAQYQLNDHWAFALALNTRWSRMDSEQGVLDSNSGGFIAFVSPGVVTSFIKDLIFQINVMVPAISNLNGEHHEGLEIRGGLTVDF
ncbi:MAG: hypothetical protein KDD48_00920 [Bdellovibrionales bacterium]|nr:hypothetical protein [Bdellovibrionales bacterium]